MKIAAVELDMQSSSSLSTQTRVEQSLKITRREQSLESVDGGRGRAINSAPVSISELARFVQDYGLDLSHPDAALHQLEELDQASELDPRVLFIKSLLEFMLGTNIDLFPGFRGQRAACGCNAPSVEVPNDSVPSRAPSANAWRMEYHAKTVIDESEQTAFQAKGKIKTEDGREIQFDLQFLMQRRSHSESETDLVAQGGKKIDPLALNFGNAPLGLTEKKYAFDLNADGKAEQISFVEGGAFLALDRNHNGKIDDGSELFGTKSGNGFADLVQFDLDHNGWIDENDPIYQHLQVWSKDQSGKDQLLSLKSAQVGAISLTNVQTSFSIKGQQNQNLGQLAASGVWLSEAGLAHAAQQVDLIV